MSQGELHALGLSLFLPRATRDESPFRFLLIDDPVQAMDPAKVDGLARVLSEIAKTRQVVVFSHDDRLADAVRRLPDPARVYEVQRRERSQVHVVPNSDPITRYLSDATAVIKDEDMPDDLRREIVANCCRGALEAAAHAKVRRVRLGRGDAHADVERALAKADKTHDKMTLAVFDDPDLGSKLLATPEPRCGRWAGDALQACKRRCPPDLRRRPRRRWSATPAIWRSGCCRVNEARRVRLDQAEKLLDGGSRSGVWPRWTVWLIRLAVEHELDALWARRSPDGDRLQQARAAARARRRPRQRDPAPRHRAVEHPQPRRPSPPLRTRSHRRRAAGLARRSPPALRTSRERT